jgi:1,4-dihydroxy-6-naphthoate synthase
VVSGQLIRSDHWPLTTDHFFAVSSSLMPRDARPILRLGHSPDPDDAFMWWPLFEIDGAPPVIDTGRFRFESMTADIESLNQRAESSNNPLEITAISCAQYPRVQQRYALTSCGASMGERYGPKLVANRDMPLDELRDSQNVVAVPGVRTSAFMTASMMLGPGRFRHAVVPFDQIIARVAAGEFAAGLVIHEGQLTFADADLHLVADVGEWWWLRHELPLPLGVNVVRRDLESQHGVGALPEVAGTLKRSIQYALAHRGVALGHAMHHARGMAVDLADRFVGMYVNQYTIDLGSRGQSAIEAFLGEANACGLAPPLDRSLTHVITG